MSTCLSLSMCVCVCVGVYEFHQIWYTRSYFWYKYTRIETYKLQKKNKLPRKLHNLCFNSFLILNQQCWLIKTYDRQNVSITLLAVSFIISLYQSGCVQKLHKKLAILNTPSYLKFEYSYFRQWMKKKKTWMTLEMININMYIFISMQKLKLTLKPSDFPLSSLRTVIFGVREEKKLRC